MLEGLIALLASLVACHICLEVESLSSSVETESSGDDILAALLRGLEDVEEELSLGGTWASKLMSAGVVVSWRSGGGLLLLLLLASDRLDGGS